MKIKYGALALSLAALYSCNQLDDIYKELDKENPGVVKSQDEYELTQDDYKSIAAIVKSDESILDGALKDNFLNNYAFNDAVPASKYIPMVLEERFYSWEKGSAVGVTYNSLKDLSEAYAPYAALKSYTFTPEDYADVWGFSFFAPSRDLETILAEKLASEYPEATADDLMLLKYKYSAIEPSVAPLLTDDFEADLSKWTLVDNGVKPWGISVYNDNHYAQLSAYKVESDVLSYLVSQPLEIKGDELFSFETAFDYMNGEAHDVLISENFDGSTIDESEWKSIKDEFTYPEDVRVFEESGDFSLADYAGKTIYVAFKYSGNGIDGATTTVRFDNVKVGAPSGDGSEPTPADTLSLYRFDGTAWATENADNAYILTAADYDAMGAPGKYDNFNNAAEAQEYIATFLVGKYPFAQVGQSEIIIANIYKDGYRAFEFVFNGAEWVVDTYEVIEKEKYIRLEDSWAFDATFTLEVGTPEYQVILDWVKENKPSYIDPKYDTSEFWFGGSTYYGNFNNQLIKRRSNDPDGILTDMDDAEAKEYLTAQTAKGIMLALATLYDIPAKDKNGMDQVLVVSAKVYDGSNWRYTYTMKSLGNDEFEWNTGDLEVTAW